MTSVSRYDQRTAPRPTPHHTLILRPAFALVSMKLTLNSRALASPSSIETCLCRCRAVLCDRDRGRARLGRAGYAPYAWSDHTRLYFTASLPGCIPHLLSTRSVLLPTRKMITSLPLSVRTSWIHRAVLRKDCRSASHTPTLIEQRLAGTSSWQAGTYL